jgi:hypothetical protein
MGGAPYYADSFEGQASEITPYFAKLRRASSYLVFTVELMFKIIAKRLM